MEVKGRAVAEFNYDEWMYEFAFVVNITNHLNELSTCLQGKIFFFSTTAL
jgi:hypothetical protein